MKELQELSLKLEEVFCNYGFEYYDPLLDYVAIMAEEYKPPTPEDFESGYYISKAINDFVFRYLDGRVDKRAMTEFLSDNSLTVSIKAMGYDVDKFWYLLMFIHDYSLGFCQDGINKKEAPKEQISKLINAIIENITSADNNTGEVIFDKPAEIVLDINGKHKITIDNPLALYWLASVSYNELEMVENGSTMATSITKLKVKNGHLVYDPLPNTFQISYFIKMFISFFELKPPIKGVQKKDSLIFYNKKLLISKLIYITKLSKKDSFYTSDKNINGFLKQSKDLEKYRYNGLYL